MKKIIGVCGALCHECPGFIATQNNDDELREKTAKEWSKLYNADLKAEYINCDGCTVPGKKIGHCNACEIENAEQKKEWKTAGTARNMHAKN